MLARHVAATPHREEVHLDFGLIFRNNHGSFFEYRSLQHAYTFAFKRAGLSYGETHNFRHGGCQDFFNRNGGNFALTGQLSGNEDTDTVRIYARRSKSALREAVARGWSVTRKGWPSRLHILNELAS